jgi:polyisoprenoid-binding protein YceI
MATTKWALDPMHSELQFKVKHLMISTVTGSFTKFEATAETEEEDFSTAKINFSADIDSINTHNEMRDNHLKTGDFFDAAQFPKMTFVSTSMVAAGGDQYTLHGDLTLRGVTLPISMSVEFGGTAKDPYGNYRAGFTLDGQIDRTQFGMHFNGPLETGGVMLGEEVKIHAAVQLIKA